jgi:adhesin transport system membrane fusion protein
MNWLWLLSRDPERSVVVDHKQQFRPQFNAIRMTLLVLLVFLVWASFAKIDQVTRAEGEVIASSTTQIVQSEENGSIAVMHVKEGDVVKRGELLVELDSTEARAGFLEAQGQKVALEITLARLSAEVFGVDFVVDDKFAAFPDFVNNQRGLYDRRKQALMAELDALAEISALAQQELSLNEPLVDEGHVSETEVLRLRRQVAELEAQAANVRNQFFKEAQAEMGEVQEELSAAEQTLVQRQRRLRMTNLVSPADGVVKNIRFRTERGVVRASEEVLEIVPVDDDLIVEAKVSPSDIAFLEIGLPVTVKLSAYDFTVYGDFAGELVYISADTLVEETEKDQPRYYRIRVKTSGNRLQGDDRQALTILPGMLATVEVITGRNTVLSYITKPLVKTLSQSLGER